MEVVVTKGDMDIEFVDRTVLPNKFFDILPSDWQAVIIPFWKNYENSARIYTLESSGEVLGGGIVFSSVSPDAMAYKEEAQRWLDRGYLYIGFLWIAEVHRSRGLGSLWLQHLKETFSGQPFWLAIDDYELAAFYIRQGFQVVKKVNAGEWDEWILVKR